MRAKFRVSAAIPDAMSNTCMEAGPVIAGSEENKQFWEATPAGYLTMTITNPAAKTFFKAGREYYLDFTPADDEAIDSAQPPTDGDSGLTEQEEQERDAYLLDQAIAEELARNEEESDI